MSAALALLSENDVRDPWVESPPPPTADQPPEPPWIGTIAARLKSLLALRQNWDSYGAPALRPQTLDAAFEILKQVTMPSTPAPDVVPTVHGGVQFEWHRQGMDLEVEVSSPFRFVVFYENSRTGDAHEQELTADLSALRGWIGLLSA